jgi:hypothetical protein
MATQAVISDFYLLLLLSKQYFVNFCHKNNTAPKIMTVPLISSYCFGKVSLHSTHGRDIGIGYVMGAICKLNE